MHKLIEKEVKEVKGWIENLKKFDKVCFELDDIKEEVERIDGVEELTFRPYTYAVEVYIDILHTKHISKVVKIFSKHFGKIEQRYINPSNSLFEIRYKNGVRLHFVLTGSLCKRVKIGEETKVIDIFELQCENGETKIITEDSLKVEED